MKKRGRWVIAAVCLVLAAAAISAGQVLKVLNSNRVCGGAAEDVESFLEEFQQQKEVTLLKSAQKGPVMAVIYEREDLGMCVALFERRLLGLRWHYEGMDTLWDNGLQLEGGWTAGGIRGSRYRLAVVGDNRDGAVGSYELPEVPEATRSGLEQDYIIDLYVLDGEPYEKFHRMRNSFRQYTPSGEIFVREN